MKMEKIKYITKQMIEGHFLRTGTSLYWYFLENDIVIPPLLWYAYTLKVNPMVIPKSSELR